MNEPVRGEREYHGHKTMPDGSHVPLTKDEAIAIMRAVETARAERARKMPTARNALHALIEAEQRMKELGWWLGGGLRVKPGDECAVAETGSTGMWRGRVHERFRNGMDGQILLTSHRWSGLCEKMPGEQLPYRASPRWTLNC